MTLNEITNEPAKVAFLAISFVAFLELVAAFVFLNISKQFIANSRIVKAKIIKLEPFGNGIAKAHLLFKDQLGKEVEAVVKVDKKRKKGDEIEVLSHKENPSKIKLNTFFALWILPFVMFSASVMQVFVLMQVTATGVTKFPF